MKWFAYAAMINVVIVGSYAHNLTESFAETHLSNDNIGRQEREQQQIQRPIAFVVPNKRRRIQQPQQETMHSARSSQTFTSQQLPSEESVVASMLHQFNQDISLRQGMREQRELLNVNESSEVELSFIPSQFLFLPHSNFSRAVITVLRQNMTNRSVYENLLAFDDYILFSLPRNETLS